MQHTHEIKQPTTDEVFTLAFDFKFEKDKVTVLESCDGISSNYSGFSQAHRGENLKVILIKNLAKYYKYIFLIGTIEDAKNNECVLEYYSKKKDEHIIMCPSNKLIHYYDPSIHNQKNSIAVALDHTHDNIDLLHYCACYHINLTVLSPNDLLQNCYYNKAFFYLFCQYHFKGSENIIPTTHVVNRKLYDHDMLDEFKGSHIILKPASASMGVGVCVMTKNQARKFIPKLFNNETIETTDPHLLQNIKDLRASIAHSEYMVLQQMTHSDSDVMSGYDYTARAAYNVYARMVNGHPQFDIQLLGMYCKLPRQPVKQRDGLTIANIVSLVDESTGQSPRPFPKNKLAIADRQLKNFIQLLLAVTYPTTLCDFLLSRVDKEPSYDAYFHKYLTRTQYRLDYNYSNQSKLTPHQQNILIRQFSFMLQTLSSSRDFNLINSAMIKKVIDIFMGARELHQPIILTYWKQFEAIKDAYPHVLTDSSPPEYQHFVIFQHLFVVFSAIVGNKPSVVTTSTETLLALIRDKQSKPLTPRSPSALIQAGMYNPRTPLLGDSKASNACGCCVIL